MWSSIERQQQLVFTSCDLELLKKLVVHITRPLIKQNFCWLSVSEPMPFVSSAVSILA